MKGTNLNLRLPVVVLLSILFQVGCSYNDEPEPEFCDNITYDGVILPIFQSKCGFSGCHPASGNWFDYNTAKSKASEIKTRTSSTGLDHMPKGGASAPGGDLSADQVMLIACWVDKGAPKN